MKNPIFYSFLKIVVYYVCKGVGLFKLSRFLTRRGLRILCYHGFEIDDESKFSPLTFIKTETFRKRLHFLKENSFRVIRIEDALKLIKEDKLQPDSIVITIDDGFYSTYKIAAPILKEYSFPAVLYVTTYYVLKQTPVFRLVVQYMFWKTERVNLDISELINGISGTVNILGVAEKKTIIWKIINYGENECEERKREIVLRKLGKRLNVSFDKIEQSRMLNMMNLKELKDIQLMGINLELHTHRHNFPVEKNTALMEIEDNRKVLESELDIQTEHFCYPSGLWNKTQFPWLENVGIQSAVTCDPGLNYLSDNKFSLNRFLDGENISNIEFEAELFGFSELMRRIKKTLSHFPHVRKVRTL